MKPPTIFQLMDDPVYYRMFKTIPRLPESLRHGDPWAVWARKTDGRWMGGNFPDYRTAWGVVVKAMRNDAVEDVSIVSRRLMIPPPPGAHWEWRYGWCSRCRRPTSFAIRPGHHALTKAPVRITDPSEPKKRCYYCGMREVSMPTYTISGRQIPVPA
jgi:hypothetical protein